MGGPLQGLKVLDIATVLAGPFTATLLADYGADVLKLELPGKGDGMRAFPPLKDGKSLWWKAAQRGKRHGTLDLRKAAGRALFKRLLPQFDVLIENFRPGTLDRWGLTREVLWALQPCLVILRVSAFGQDGPYAGRPGFARIFEAMGGLTAITGERDGEPMHLGVPLGDSIGGLFGAIGVLAALWPRAKAPSLPGEEIDLSLTEGITRLLDFLPGAYQHLGVVPARNGNRSPYSAPSAVYRTRDQHWVSMSGSLDSMFANNCRAIGRSDLVDDPRFVDNASRVQHEQELNEIFRSWVSLHDLDTVLRAFREASGTLSPIYTIDQIVSDPQVTARGSIVSMADRDIGCLQMPAVVPRFLRQPGLPGEGAGELGRDNDEIYGKRLGLSKAEIAALRAESVI
ncbi:crotonobetainyl-CoA:carnitine CoA-transferase CaiB-like acyl-CoA transferase [Variovorax boronicumulans]|uniref:CaiB/BaiF CoA transferase family protein n=1 Tax=Variovorax boronicumulans TaxID=436515 RepID=UPI00278230EC|nr:CaiB/BaiF CoA-transferase family protein [Variovorax boronicumulans]MDP9917422.1 crotonobetainyl-CoA:carnitine CoA-transferase CaiB-like acyl-CoA transferase [Variovorax boronicumulans]